MPARENYDLKGTRSNRVFSRPAISKPFGFWREQVLSSIAGRNELFDWADGVRQQGSVENWFLVYGEPYSQQALAEGLAARGAKDVVIPERLERIEI